ncbi:hypothetical protein BDY17DRAFT_308624 [Neohortaea acidophila]|uniref:F-box domain-containing protein n=1 Tax=Neohortaea acidophila TaxID=245834 RepID=A0A6A6PZL4_9PEZI|nr:uncharacterized protein BDY17DRAFT_308624 [Neohortaea acidophila]KAF2485179.1 hypothetical protein BDY17DRAFT_308624 [Neohortaea acidophila]
MSTSNQTSILFTLPLEIRHQIYSYVYTSSVRPHLGIHTDTHLIDLLSLGEDPAPCLGLALLQTCRALYHDARPFLYAQQTFSISISVSERDHRKRVIYAGHLDRTNKLLRSIQHLEIILTLNHDWHVDLVLRRLRLLAAELGEEGATLKSWEVTAYATRTFVTTEFVASRITEMLKQLDEAEEESRGGDELFRSMLVEMEVKSWSRYLHWQCTACDPE